MGSIDEFRAFELRGWQAAVTAYHQGYAGLTKQSIGPLLGAVELKRGDLLLDVATGPGYVAEAALHFGAKVLALDFSPHMLALAQERLPQLACLQGDAEQLPVMDGCLDAVVMNYGMLHLARPEMAIRESFRVLKPGGKFAFTVWAPPERAIVYGIVLGAVRAYGTLDVPIPEGSPFFRFSEPGETARVLLSTGFVEIQIVEVPQVWRLESAESLFHTMQSGTVRTAALLRAQKPEALGRIRAAILDGVAPYRRGSHFELPTPAVLASGRKPSTPQAKSSEERS